MAHFSVSRALRRLIADRRGTMTVEAVIILPIVAWALMATFVFFDAFRVSTASQKAAYAVADALSRQTDPIDQDYVNGMNIMHDLIGRTRKATGIRVSSIGYSNLAQEHIVIWSIPTRNYPALTNEVLNEYLAARIPSFGQGETIILVETEVEYTPNFRVGIPAQTFRQAIVTRPRFAPQVAFFDGTSIIVGPTTCDDGAELCI